MKSLYRFGLLSVGLLLLSAGCQKGVSESSAPGPEPEKRGAEAEAPPEAEGASAEGATSKAKEPWMPQGRFVDLTHTFDEETIYWPTEDGFKLEPEFAGVTERGYYYTSNRFSAAEHGGTHMDAPIHFYEGRKTLDAVPLERLIGEGVVVDVSAKCAEDRDYQVTIDDLRGWEERHERPLVDVIVLLKTGFGEYWPDREKYMGTAELGEEAVAKLHFPGLHPDAAGWLVEHRRVKAVGLDTPSIDYGQSKEYGSHVTLFEANVPAFENVANLDGLPGEGFTVIALPMKIGGGSGGPLRIVAVVPEAGGAD